METIRERTPSFHVTTESQTKYLFNLPFIAQKCIYSENSSFFDEGNFICGAKLKQVALDIDDEHLLHKALPKFVCEEAGCKITFNSLRAYEIHYESVHRHVCLECKRSYPSSDLLDFHIQKEHDSYSETAEEKKMYSYDCIVKDCSLSFSYSKERDEHMIRDHKYPPNFKFGKLRAKKHGDEMMDVNECITGNPKGTVRKYNPRIPQNICFGHGSSKTFQSKICGKRTKGNNKKNADKQVLSLDVCSRDISMKELQDAL